MFFLLELAKQGINVKKTKIGVLNTVSTNTLLGRGEVIRMGPNDWEVVLEGKSVKTFEDGEIILKEGSKVDSIYQVSSGRVRISKKTVEGEVTLAYVLPPLLEHFFPCSFVSEWPNVFSVSSVARRVMTNG